MKKQYFSIIFLFAICAVCFIGCYKPIDDPVVTGIDKNEQAGTVKIYFAFEKICEKNSINFNSEVDEFIAMWKSTPLNRADTTVAKKDGFGWYVELPLDEEFMIFVGLRSEGKNIFLVVDNSSFILEGFKSILSISIVNMQ